MAAEMSPSATPWRWPLALWILTLVAASAAASWQRHANERLMREHLRTVAVHAGAQVRQLLQTYESGLLGVRSAVALTDDGSYTGMTRRDFRRLVDSMELPRRFPGCRGFAFVRRVPDSQLAGFLAAARRDDAPQMRLQEISPHPGDHLVIQFIEPLQTNAQALGLDIASEADRREAAWAAARSGDARLSAPVTLVQTRGTGEHAVALMLPVYRTGLTPVLEQREQDVIGWVAAPLVMADMLKILDGGSSALVLAVTDTTRPQAPQRLFSSQAWQGDDTVVASTETLELYGRTWQVSVQSTPALVAQVLQHSPGEMALAMAAVGSVLSLLLYFALRPVARRRAIAHERAQTAALVASAHDAIIRHTPQDHVLSWNAAAQRLLGWSEEQARGRALMDLTVPVELQPQAREFVERVQRGEDVPPFETVRLDRQGHRVAVSLSVVPIRDADGRIVGSATTMRDIREQLTAREQVQQLNTSLQQQVQQVQQRTAEMQALAERERAILASAASAIIAMDLEGRIIAFNPAACALFRLSEPQALGRSVVEFCDLDELAYKARFFPQEVKDNAARLPHALRQGIEPNGHTPHPGAARGEWTYRRSDGSTFPGLLNISVLRGGHGEAQGFLAVIADLTERRAMEEALRQRTAALEAAQGQLRERTHQAEAANRAKTAFLANMSHEIRTPLNAVIGLSHLLTQTPLDERQGRFVHNINTAGEQLLALLNDILDISKIEAGEMVLDTHALDLPALLQEVCAVSEDQAAGKGVALRCVVEPGMPKRVCGDAVRIKQVLTNLLSNAIKFTDAGSVTLWVRQVLMQERPVEDAWQRISVRFDVTDTGIGIPLEKQEAIFQPFTQADSSTTRRFGGTGLGLSIVRRLVELMDGRLAVQSTVGQGSTFSVTLTLKLPKP